ncbi:hypothetical protein [Serratia fonticola]
MGIKLDKCERSFFEDNTMFGNQLTDDALKLIIDAYQLNCRKEREFSSLGARRFSVTHLAAAHYHRTVRDTLTSVLRLLCTDVSNDDHEASRDELESDAPDVSLILKEEVEN